MLDGTTVNLALYPMSKGLDVSISEVQWVVIAYMLVLTVFLPFFGKLGDILPKNKLYAAGFLIFALGSFLNFTAPNLPLLITYRCIEAIGASIMISNSSAIIATIFKNEKRGQALGINGGIIAIGGMSGPAIGGILINFFGWHSIFLPCIPIALLGAYYSYKFLPSHPSAKKQFKFDYPGFIYFTISIFALLLAISEGHEWGWTSLRISILGILCFGFGGLFYFRDHYINYPLVNFDMFKIRTFTLGNLAVLTSYMAMFTNGILLPFFLQVILKLNPLVTGLLILPFSVTLSVIAPLSGKIAGKYGSKYLTIAGPIVMIIALLIFSTFDTNTKIWEIIVASGVMGIGNGLFQSPSNTAIITSAPKNELGVASGILALSRNMGNILGVALTITLFEAFKSDFMAGGMIYSDAFLKSYHLTMTVGMGFAVLCLILAFFAYKDKKTAN